MNYWLVKSEPYKYAWADLIRDGQTFWDGVRNYQARNNLQAMKVGDLVMYYHSNDGKEIVGYAKVVKEAYQDPTTDDNRWVVVDLAPVEALPKPVTLEHIKNSDKLGDIALIKQPRLSVMPLKQEEFDAILEISNHL
ncbi:EVE domain-containing protein [Eisenibacter elegans]|jgi:predicted RNA-binding protein with PUA-like domain|uniref:EVE domain-containing protein n=1 Tax=Eisenibacter elegans TaxID=997 RepID=UPI0004170E99|nr:EVE domain-containing protein [Eisenibacter elegans]